MMADSNHNASKMCLFDPCWCSHQQAVQKLKKQSDSDDEGEGGSGQCEPYWWGLLQEEALLGLVYDVDRLQRAQMLKNMESAQTERRQVDSLDIIATEAAQPKHFVKAAFQQNINHSGDEPSFMQQDEFSIDKTVITSAENENNCAKVSSLTTEDSTFRAEENWLNQRDLESTEDECWMDTSESLQSTATKSLEHRKASTLTNVTTLAATAFVVTAMEQQMHPVIKLAQALTNYFNTAPDLDTATPTVSQSLPHSG